MGPRVLLCDFSHRHEVAMLGALRLFARLGVNCVVGALLSPSRSLSLFAMDLPLARIDHSIAGGVAQARIAKRRLR